MKTSFKLLLAAGVLSVAGFASIVPAAAQPSSFSFRMGDVAIGYSDGYYDRSHNWHQWRNAREHREQPAEERVETIAHRKAA